jgi:hypothetical protein
MTVWQTLEALCDVYWLEGPTLMITSLGVDLRSNIVQLTFNFTRQKAVIENPGLRSWALRLLPRVGRKDRAAGLQLSPCLPTSASGMNVLQTVRSVTVTGWKRANDLLSCHTQHEGSFCEKTRTTRNSLTNKEKRVTNNRRQLSAVWTWWFNERVYCAMPVHRVWKTQTIVVINRFAIDELEWSNR